jgi:HAMP domain-containing protein
MIKLRHRLSIRIAAILSVAAIPVLALFAIWVARGESAEIEEITVQEGRIAATAGAAAYGAILDAGVASGEIKLEDLLNPTYEEIHYPGLPTCPIGNQAIGKPGDPPPPPCLEDPRYRVCRSPDPVRTAAVVAGEATADAGTGKARGPSPCEPGFDSYTDRHGIQGIEDAILASHPAFLYASGIARGGYVPTPHKRYDETPTGNPVHDRAHSRQKRKYSGEQRDAADFISSQHEPTLVLPYARDTGDIALDVAATIFVGGRPFGAFRVGVARDGIVARQRVRMLTLVPIFGALALAMALFTFLLLRRSIRPLEDLTASANLISTGVGMDKDLRSARKDEIGMMTKSVNRLRSSLLAAMERLGE